MPFLGPLHRVEALTLALAAGAAVAAASVLVAAQDPWAARRERMVEGQVAARGVRDSATLAALRSVPRHAFVPDRYTQAAYDDRPLPIGLGQTISQPYIVGYMTERLRPEASDRVLEVGTGSGYQAAVLAAIVDSVYTIEIFGELARAAEARLDRLGYDNVRVRHGDGYHGWPQAAPFDAVIVTAAAGHIPPALVEQLKPGGRMMIPVGSVHGVQTLILISKAEDGTVTTQSLLPVRFVPLLRGTR